MARPPDSTLTECAPTSNHARPSRDDVHRASTRRTTARYSGPSGSRRADTETSAAAKSSSDAGSGPTTRRDASPLVGGDGGVAAVATAFAASATIPNAATDSGVRDSFTGSSRIFARFAADAPPTATPRITADADPPSRSARGVHVAAAFLLDPDAARRAGTLTDASAKLRAT